LALTGETQNEKSYIRLIILVKNIGEASRKKAPNKASSETVTSRASQMTSSETLFLENRLDLPFQAIKPSNICPEIKCKAGVWLPDANQGVAPPP
jgi:hypothetical protein